jgi:hypothetical protein
MSRWAHRAAAAALLVGISVVPAEASAREEPPAAVAYGFDGFWTGAQIGLASGFLATGRHYEDHEWRKLVWGAGLGALVGAGVGITLGIVDVGSPPPHTGHLVLRDIGYGVGLGAIAGAAVGALYWADGGEPKNLLTGAAIGTLAGAGAGVVFGLLEGALAPRESAVVQSAGASWRLSLIGSGASYLPMPAIVGRF